MYFNNSFYIASYRAAINFLFWISSLFFRFFYLKTRFLSVLTLEFSGIYQLLKLFPSFWGFLVLFWMLWMLVTVHKRCHVPRASRKITWGTIFTKIFFSASKEWVKYWSSSFLITYLKRLAKKLLAVCPEKVTIRRKRKTRMAIPFYSNAITSFQEKEIFIFIW